MTLTPPDPATSQQNFARLQSLSRQRAAQETHRALTEPEQEELAEETTCIHCGGFHVRACPRVKRICFNPTNGRVSEVEYWPVSKIDWTGVVFDDGTSVEAGEEAGFWTNSEFEPDLDLALLFIDGDVVRDDRVNQAIRRLKLLVESLRVERVQSEDASSRT